MFLNSHDWSGVKEKVLSDGFAIVDNFFKSKKALQIRKEILNTDVYEDVYEDGYEATNYGKDYKLSNEISKEISKGWPELHNQYQRSWAVVFDNETEGVPIHCDHESMLTLNIWLTSESCIKNINKNGLVIYKVRPPIEFKDTHKNNLVEAWKNWVDIHKHIKPQEIEYKFNRAIFNSGYLHKTNGVSMKDGKENKRVTLALIFGDLYE
jgi:hypothetical protein